MARSFEQWNAQPNRFDIPDVDTPKRNAEQQEPKTEDEQAPRAFQPSPSSNRRFTKYRDRQSYAKNMWNKILSFDYYKGAYY